MAPDADTRRQPPVAGGGRAGRSNAAVTRGAAPALLLSLVSAVGASACADHPEERGRQLFAQHGCAVCHGAEGRGDGPSAKRLDVPPGDFADPRTYRQGVSPNDIAASIRNGAGAMPAFHDISDAESAEIAAWIVSLQGGARTARGRP